jgi:hypothetical protein
MGMQIYGVLAAENRDNVGDLIKVANIDTSKLTKLLDEHHEEPSFFDTLGSINFHKKILSEADCENPRQKACWDRTKVPLLYIEAELADDTDHPNAKAAAALIRFCARPEIPLKPGLSVDGRIIERVNDAGQPDEHGKILEKTMAIGGSLTTKPCNPKCFLMPMNDLTKSDAIAMPPARYWEALRKSQATTSFNELSPFDFALYLGLTKLKKSLADYAGGFTSIRCKKCGDGVRFFKSSNDLPNGCPKCRNHFSMSEIWQALNK